MQPRTWGYFYVDANFRTTLPKEAREDDGRPIDVRTEDEDGSVTSRTTYEYTYANSLFKTKQTVVGDADAPDVVTTTYKDNMDQTVKTGKFLNGREYFDTYTYDNDLLSRAGNFFTLLHSFFNFKENADNGTVLCYTETNYEEVLSYEFSGGKNPERRRGQTRQRLEG